MAHVRIERLRTGDGKHHRAHRHERHPALIDEEGQRIRRRQALEDRRPFGDQARPGERQRPEPQQHHRAEQGADPLGAPALRGEQRRERADGERHDDVAQAGVDDLETLHR
jgi:hypothetical protein